MFAWMRDCGVRICRAIGCWFGFPFNWFMESLMHSKASADLVAVSLEDL